LQQQAHDWLVLLTSGQATTADADALRAWCALSDDHAYAFAQAKALWHGLGAAAAKTHGPRIGRRALLAGAIAASAAAVAVSYSVPGGWRAIDADYQTAVGEQRQVQLASGITLQLNTRTRLNQQVLPAGLQNIELLHGEISVQAPADSTVRVQSGAGWMAARNARFNVRRLDERTCIACLEGIVQVQVGSQQISVSQGRELVYAGQVVDDNRAFDPAAIDAWTQKRLVFNDTPLAQVIDEVNRYRPGRLVLLNTTLGQRKVQVRLGLDQLAGFAQMIHDAYGATCTELPGGVVVIS